MTYNDIANGSAFRHVWPQSVNRCLGDSTLQRFGYKRRKHRGLLVDSDDVGCWGYQCVRCTSAATADIENRELCGITQQCLPCPDNRRSYFGFLRSHSELLNEMSPR